MASKQIDRGSITKIVISDVLFLFVSFILSGIYTNVILSNYFEPITSRIYYSVIFLFPLLYAVLMKFAIKSVNLPINAIRLIQIYIIFACLPSLLWAIGIYLIPLIAACTLYSKLLTHSYMKLGDSKLLLISAAITIGEVLWIASFSLSDIH